MKPLEDTSDIMNDQICVLKLDLGSMWKINPL